MITIQKTGALRLFITLYNQKSNTLVFTPRGIYSKKDKKGKEQASESKLEYTED